MSKRKDEKETELQEKTEDEVVETEDSEIDPVQEELKKKDEEIEKIKDQLLRNMAEYDNYRKRTSRERMELEPEITAKTVTEFLTVADNLERAMDTECADENFKKGVEMIYQSFMEILNNLGVEQIPAEGDFDPSVHQAVQQVPASEGQTSGEIAATFQRGYKIGNKILRFAMVAVVA